MDEEPRDVVRVARRPRRIDRKRDDLVVGAVEEEMEGLRPEAVLFEPARQLQREVARRHQHIVDEPDRLGKAPLGVMVDRAAGAARAAH